MSSQLIPVTTHRTINSENNQPTTTLSSGNTTRALTQHEMEVAQSKKDQSVCRTMGCFKRREMNTANNSMFRTCYDCRARKEEAKPKVELFGCIVKGCPYVTDTQGLCQYHFVECYNRLKNANNNNDWNVMYKELIDGKPFNEGSFNPYGNGQPEVRTEQFNGEFQASWSISFGTIPSNGVQSVLIPISQGSKLLKKTVTRLSVCSFASTVNQQNNIQVVFWADSNPTNVVPDGLGTSTPMAVRPDYYSGGIINASVPNGSDGAIEKYKQQMSADLVYLPQNPAQLYFHYSATADSSSGLGIRFTAQVRFIFVDTTIPDVNVVNPLSATITSPVAISSINNPIIVSAITSPVTVTSANIPVTVINSNANPVKVSTVGTSTSNVTITGVQLPYGRTSLPVVIGGYTIDQSSEVKEGSYNQYGNEQMIDASGLPDLIENPEVWLQAWIEQAKYNKAMEPLSTAISEVVHPDQNTVKKVLRENPEIERWYNQFLILQQQTELSGYIEELSESEVAMKTDTLAQDREIKADGKKLKVVRKQQDVDFEAEKQKGTKAAARAEEQARQQQQKKGAQQLPTRSIEELRTQRKEALRRIWAKTATTIELVKWLIQQLAKPASDLSKSFLREVVNVGPRNRTRVLLMQGIDQLTEMLDLRNLIVAVVRDEMKDDSRVNEIDGWIKDADGLRFVVAGWVDTCGLDGDVELNPGDVASIIANVLMSKLTQAVNDAVGAYFQAKDAGTVDQPLEQKLEQEAATLSARKALKRQVVDNVLANVLSKRGVAEAGIIKLLSLEAGKALSREEADKMLRQASADPSYSDRLITGLANLTGKSNYIGPNYTGGQYGGVHSVRDLAERLTIKPLSKADEIARKHDLFYSVADEPEDRVEADKIMIDELDKLEEPTVQSSLASAALKAKEYTGLYDLFGYRPPEKDLTTEGIEPNPGPIEIGEVLSALVRILTSERWWEGMTIMGISPSGHLGPGDQMSQAVHDHYFLARAKRRQISRQNISIIVDGVISGCDLFPAVIPARDGTAEARNFLGMRFRENVGSRGPRLIDGILAAPFLQVQNEEKLEKVFKVMLNTNSLVNGVANYTVWKGAENDPANGKFSESGGSNSGMFARLFAYMILLNVNCRKSMLQNSIRGLIVKPESLVVGQIPFPNNQPAIQAVNMWAMNPLEYIQYSMNRVTAGSAAAAWTQPPIVIFINSAQNRIEYINELNLYTMLHLPYPVYTTIDTATVKGYRNDGPNAAGRVATSTIGNSSFQGTPEPDGSINVIFVSIDFLARPGAMGQPNLAFTIALGDRNNPTLVDSIQDNPNVQGNVGVNGLAPLRAGMLNMAATDMTGVGSIVLDWLIDYYGSKLDLTTGTLQAMMMVGSFFPVPVTTLSGEFIGAQFTGGERMLEATTPQVLGIPVATNDSLAALYAETFDVFGNLMLPVDAANPIYYSGTMNPIRRLALVMGLKAVAAEDKISRKLVTNMSPMRIYTQLTEMAEAMATIADGSRAKTGLAESMLGGYVDFPGSRNADRSITFNQGLHDSMLALFGIPGMIICRPAPMRQPTLWSQRTRSLQLVFDKAWEGTKYYRLVAESLYRPDAPEPVESVTESVLRLGPNPLPQLSSLMKMQETDGPRVSKWLQPNYNYTQLRIASNRGYSIAMVEAISNNAAPVFVTQLLDTASLWWDHYVGSTAAVTQSGPAAINVDVLISDYSHFQMRTAYRGQKAWIGLNAATVNALANNQVPAFEAFRPVDHTMPNFNLPSIINTFPEYDEVLKSFKTGDNPSNQ